MKTAQQLANAIARKEGHGKATKVVLGDKNYVVEAVAFGYRKNSDGAYVSSAYRRNFGWKNTFYQHAVCAVEVDVSRFPQY